ncbi:ABC transporter ATP-binding protein [Candidatus Bipolaricaulota bacterium]|nr:ABC transporter ATP-binding protein [Candidatus Bipolaricaulota bacterium]
MNLITSQLAFAYSPEREILSSVTLSLGPGDVMFILGANGTGKTTLVECMSGLRLPLRGSVTIDGQNLYQLSVRTRAQNIGLVPQMHEPVFAFTVEQTVLMGRAPHLGLFGRPSRQDHHVVGEVIEAVGIQHLRHRAYTKISGGERQLALIARGLAQGAQCLFMDEPVAHLDPHHQHDVMSVVRQLADEGFSFVVTSHLPNHALLYGDWVAFLTDGRADVQGTPGTTITEQTLKVAYDMDFEIVEGSTGSRAVLPRLYRNPNPMTW